MVSSLKSRGGSDISPVMGIERRAFARGRFAVAAQLLVEVSQAIQATWVRYLAAQLSRSAYQGSVGCELLPFSAGYGVKIVERLLKTIVVVLSMVISRREYRRLRSLYSPTAAEVLAESFPPSRPNVRRVRAPEGNKAWCE